MLYDLSSLGLLKITGKDANKLLQGQLSCDVNEVTENQSRLSALCNPQGRVINLFYLFFFQDAYFLVMNRHLISITQNALKKYAIFYQVELMNASLDFFMVGVNENDDALPEHIALIKMPDVSGSRFILISKNPIDLKKQSIDEWNYLNIINKIPSIYPETSGKFLPHDLNLQKLNAISFNKGCFTGQEIIARMHYRAKLKKHLYLATYINPKKAPTRLEAIYALNSAAEVEECGVIVDLVNKEYNQYNLLIITEEEHAKNDHLFFISDQQNYLRFNAS